MGSNWSSHMKAGEFRLTIINQGLLCSRSVFGNTQLQHLHTPRDFFHLNLSLLDLGSMYTTLPRSMATSGTLVPLPIVNVLHRTFFSSFSLRQNIPFSPSCPTTSLCPSANPCGHSRTLLGSRACAHMAAAAGASGFLAALLLTAKTFSVPLCQGNALRQFFCESSLGQ